MTSTSDRSTTTTTVKVRPDRRRQIGVVGTTARVAVGLWMAGSVVQGQWAAGFRPASWLLGVVGFPALVLAWQWWRARRRPSRFEATGPLAHVLNLVVFLALYLTPWYAPSLSATSDAALLFYGASMLLAALRGYAGCELLAVSNWVLERDDQVGCLVFAPVDHLEQRTSGVHPSRWRVGGDAERDGVVVAGLTQTQSCIRAFTERCVRQADLPAPTPGNRPPNGRRVDRRS